MAGSARRIVVEFLGDGKNLTRELGDMETHTGKWGSMLGKVGKMAGLGLAAGVTGAAVALVGMTKNAIEDEAQQRKLALAMRNSVGASDEQVASVEKWIAAQGRALGVTDDEMRPALQRLIESTGSVTEAQKQMRIAMDVSAGTGKSLETVTAAMMKANNGTTASLSKLGLKTKDAEGNALTLDQAMAKMSETFGGQAAAKAETLEGKMGRLQLIFDETKETIGGKLIPIASELADLMLTQVGPALQQAGAWAQENLLPVFDQISAAISQRMGPAFIAVSGFIRDNLLPAFAGIAADAGPIFIKIAHLLGQVADTVMKVWAVVAQNMLPVFKQLVATIRAELMPTVTKIVDRFNEWWPSISKVLIKLADIATTILGTVLPPVIRFAGFLLATLVPVILDTIEVIAKIIAKAFEFGAAFVDRLKDLQRFVDGVREKIGNVVGIVKGIPERVRNAIGDLGSILLHAGEAIIQGLIDGIQAKLGALKDMLGSVTKLIPLHKGPPDKDRALLKPAGIALIQGLIDGIDKHKVKLTTVLDKLSAYIERKSTALTAALDRKRSVLDAFAGFASSVFSANIATEPDAAGNAPASPVSQMLAFQAQQRARAEQLANDVNHLVGKGLSKDLIEQLQASGQQGIDQIHQLAGATADQIAQLNADNAATNKALMEAGLAAVHGLGIDADIKAAERDLKLAETIAGKLDDLLKQQDNNTIVELRIGGHVLHVTLLELKRKTGRDLGLG